MDKITHISAPLWPFILPLLLLWSCEHKDILCPEDTALPIEVKFEWGKAPEARVDGMALYFFSKDRRGERWRFDIAGMEGGKIEIPPGSYRMLTLNNDLPGVDFSETSDFFTFLAHTHSADPESA